MAERQRTRAEGKGPIKIGAAEDLGMTNAKFRRRYRIIIIIMGCSGWRIFLRKYNLRDKLRTRISDGLFPRLLGVVKTREALGGISHETFCGDETELIPVLRRRRAWELGFDIDTSTWLPSEEPSEEPQKRERLLVED